jgi:hypothetical protein
MYKQQSAPSAIVSDGESATSQQNCIPQTRFETPGTSDESKVEWKVIMYTENGTMGSDLF